MRPGKRRQPPFPSEARTKVLQEAGYGDPSRGGPSLRSVRCECLACGAHVMSRMLHTISGRCSTCGSYDLRIIAPETAVPAGVSDPLGPRLPQS